ncbi:hypothetical protein PM082_013439 [Marasmius tenuissimus]|nr:hypothetical protein PM082_013439 [Marasmius tenuissimus]
MNASGPQNGSLHDVIFSYLQSQFEAVIVTEQAALVILVYDYFLTLGEEIHYVWTKSRWNLPTILFFVVRYLVFIPAGVTYHRHISHSIPMEDCKAWTKAAAYSNVGVIVIIEIVLSLRAWVLWDRSKKVALCLALTILMLVAIGFHKIATIQAAQTAFSIEYYNLSGRCPPEFSGMDGDSGNNALSTGFMLIVVYESVVLVLTLIRAYQQGCEQNQRFRSYIFQAFRGRWSGSRFMDSFISQGVAYNCIILVWSTANIICRYKLSLAYVNVLVDLQLVMHAILVSRMLLHLRKQSYRRDLAASSRWSSLSGLVACNPNLPLVMEPGMSCPQITFLDLGSPLFYDCERPETSPSTSDWEHKIE